MPWLLNLVYLIGLFLLSPWLIYKFATTGKYRRGFWQKILGEPKLSPKFGFRVSGFGFRISDLVWFHGVSVGEIHLLRQVVACFRRRHPKFQCVISTTTDTAFDEAIRNFPDLPVFFWPLDFSWAVGRTLHRLRPGLIVLAESELWPNLLSAAQEQSVPVAVINARMSPRSFRRYFALGSLSRWLLNKVDLLAVQTEEFAANFRRLGVPAHRVHVTGSVKFDGVSSDRDNPRTVELRCLFDVEPGDLVWVAGSTQGPEEQITLDIYRSLREAFPRLRLFLVPRQKDRFAEVADLLCRSGLPFVRRSTLASGISVPAQSVVLVDTIGELGALWGLADVAFVGGSLDGRRGGQNMIEPAAYGAAVLFGPHVWNFQDTARRLLQVGGAVQVRDGNFLGAAVRSLLENAEERARLGSSAYHFVRQQQGATERTVTLLEPLLISRWNQQAA